MKTLSKYYVLGVDYGSDSCRVIFVDAVNGEELSSAVSYYPRWKAGKYCNSQENQYRHHPKTKITIISYFNGVKPFLICI